MMLDRRQGGKVVPALKRFAKDGVQGWNEGGQEAENEAVCAAGRDTISAGSKSTAILVSIYARKALIADCLLCLYAVLDVDLAHVFLDLAGFGWVEVWNR